MKMKRQIVKTLPLTTVETNVATAVPERIDQLAAGLHHGQFDHQSHDCCAADFADEVDIRRSGEELADRAGQQAMMTDS